MSIYPKIEVRQYAGHSQDATDYPFYVTTDTGYVACKFWMRIQGSVLVETDISPYVPTGGTCSLMLEGTGSITLTWTEAGTSNVRELTHLGTGFVVVEDVDLSDEILLTPVITNSAAYTVTMWGG